MKELSEVANQEAAMQTLVSLTGAFEGIASMRISQIKNQVLQATEFFHELWHIYSQLRVDSKFRYGRSQSKYEVIDKDLYILITAEGGFSGDIDQKLIDLMLKTYDPNKHDIVVIGHHGAIQLVQRGVGYKKYFKLPIEDQNINVGPIINQVQRYKATKVYYQQYVSLFVQDVRRIELLSVVQEQGKKAEKKEEVITEANYIFEPGTFEVVGHLEQSMLHIAMSQLILDSKLAQYASRFRAMTSSRQKADESRQEIHLLYNRTKRASKDERLKEVINGLRKVRAV